MGYSVGDLLEFKQEALSESIQVVRSKESFFGLTNIFTTEHQNEGTDVVKWRIFNDNRKAGRWGVRGTPARPMEGSGGRKLSAALGHIFMSLPIEEDVLLMIESPDDNPQQRAADWIKFTQDQLVSMGDHLIEAAIWEILQTGELAIDQSTDPNHPIIETLTFGVDAGHIYQLTTLDYSVAASKILSDPTDESWGGLLQVPEDDGFVMTEAVVNRKTNKYFFGNTEVQKLWSDRRRDILWERNLITTLDGVAVKTYNRKYENAAAALVNFVTDDLVVFLPSEEERKIAFSLEEGEVMVPDMSTPEHKLVKRMGRQSWVEYHSNPAEARIYYKRNVVPVPKLPDAWTTVNVVP